ncbi:MAG: M24 family metallopeptidase [Ancalomicrobiaceae bacterium]|nr:M24 family metallopeptidase [Ancalomicrobiaceae bacterium]
MSSLDPAVALVELDLPDFGEASVEPTIPAATYEARIATALARAAARGLEALVVYGDREHSANVTYLTGYDPRFEETLLILKPGAVPALVIGNEGWGYAELAGVHLERELFQTFSLLGQPRDRNRAIAAILAGRGIGVGQRIGTVGWKYFGPGDPGLDEASLEIPSYIADTLRRLVGPTGSVVNATDIFMSAEDGLRAFNDVDQLAVFEYASTYTSTGVRNVLFGVKPGMRESEAARLIGYNGMPMSAHLMLSSGPRASYGLPSPSAKVIERGEPLTVAYGVWGALNARAGFMVASADELPAGIRDYVEKLVAPYYSAVAAWYETLGIGVSGGELYEVVVSRLADPFFGIGLNPGHQIHLDEWLNSPITPDSRIELKSGMALQVDIIPATNSPWFTTNIEDGLILADADLRAQFAARYPEAWARIERRRAFMIDQLGIRLKPEVLPLSNIPAYLAPFLLSPHRAMAVRR